MFRIDFEDNDHKCDKIVNVICKSIDLLGKDVAHCLQNLLPNAFLSSDVQYAGFVAVLFSFLVFFLINVN